MISADTVYFISDAHLGADCPGCEAREGHLLDFLATLRGKARALFIVGDLFDFWIEYPNAIRPDYFTVLHHLRMLIESGVNVHYLAGNHDFALGPFLTDTVGISIHTGHCTLTLHGKRIHLHHGDGLVGKDIGYHFLRAVLRNRLNQRLFKLIHPDIGIPFAKFCSHASRYFLKRTCSERKLAQYRRVARQFIGRGSDIVVFGHTHRPELYDFGAASYCNTGEWIRRYTYAKLEGGDMTLWEYFPREGSRRIQAVVEPAK